MTGNKDDAAACRPAEIAEQEGPGSQSDSRAEGDKTGRVR